MEEEDSCIVTDVLETNKLLRPTLVDFDYGSLTKQNVQNIQCDMFINKENDEQTLVVSRKNQRYSGNPDKSSLCQTILLIRNKHTNRARIVPVQSCTLKMDNKRKSIAPPQELEKSVNRSVNELSQAFGSKRSKRMSDMHFKMNLDGKVRDSTIDDVADIEVTESDILNTTDNAKDSILGLIPPCNREAKDISDIYQISNIISTDELNSLNMTCKFIMENEPSETDEKSSYFIYSQYKTFGESEQRELKVKLLLYANAIVKFVNMKTGELKGKLVAKNICSNSYTIGNKILKEFTVSSDHSRLRPTYLRDKAVCFIIVLMALVNDYKINLSILTSSIKGYNLKKLHQLARLVGLTPLSSGLVNKEYILKLPLPALPVVNKARRPKKKL